MKTSYLLSVLLILLIMPVSCTRKEQKTKDVNIIFLHHSTGEIIWRGTHTPLIKKIVWRINKNLANSIRIKPKLPEYFKRYNNAKNLNYSITEIAFPKASPYGWNNFPYDYYNIWVKNSGKEPYLEEPTLELLNQRYQIIIFKHCFPVSNIQADLDSSDINSDSKTISNYKLQYLSLREKLQEFPDTKFILFTGAAQVKGAIKEDEARRSREFFNWVINEWDLPYDNIYLWDLYNLQTGGGIYSQDKYSVSEDDSHPNGTFARKTVKLLFNRIIDVIENNGSGTNITGEKKR